MFGATSLPTSQSPGAEANTRTVCAAGIGTPPCQTPLVPATRMVATPAAAVQKRFLNLHEYQSKQLMEEYGITSQRFKMANNGAEAKEAAEWLMETGAPEIVMKAQVFAGGRGKGVFSNGFKGGVQLSTDPAE
eukprot:gene12647-18517_t